VGVDPQAEADLKSQTPVGAFPPDDPGHSRRLLRMIIYVGRQWQTSADVPGHSRTEKWPLTCGNVRIQASSEPRGSRVSFCS
jgi:hypothetical protein